MAERKALWAGRGREEEEREGLRGMTVGCLVDAKEGEKPAQANGH